MSDQSYSPPPSFTGVKEVCDKNGVVIKRLSMENSKLQGASLKYDAHGHVSRVLHYNQGVLDGEVQLHKKGNIVAALIFKAGQKHGTARFYDMDGNLLSTLEYDKGLRHGPMKSFNELGNLVQVMPYVMDKKQGQSMSFYPSGEVMKTVDYESDQKHGSMVHYDKKGNPFKVAHYKKGKLLEPATIMHPSLGAMSA
jgi:uncharacterized protein